MLRRLFFLFPDEIHAQRAVDELVKNKIPQHRINAISHGVELKTLPQASDRQKNDTAFRVESFVWRMNLMLFIFGLIALVATLVAGQLLWSALSFCIMLISFIAAAQFSIKIPNVHLSEFTDALSHGEILLMIDVPKHRVAEIENFVHHRYPEAVVGGVSWSIDAFGI